MLNPALAPTVDTLYPTYGAGDFRLPVDPTLTSADFAGLTLDEIETLYYGFRGRGGWTISGWAQDKAGRHVELDEIHYVRVEVLSGLSNVSGFASVVATPERRERCRHPHWERGHDDDGKSSDAGDDDRR